MKVLLNTVPMWVCQICGHLWLVAEDLHPIHCPCCASPRWIEDRGDEPELPDAQFP